MVPNLNNIIFSLSYYLLIQLIANGVHGVLENVQSPVAEVLEQSQE